MRQVRAGSNRGPHVSGLVKDELMARRSSVPSFLRLARTAKYGVGRLCGKPNLTGQSCCLAASPSVLR